MDGPMIPRSSTRHLHLSVQAWLILAWGYYLLLHMWRWMNRQHQDKPSYVCTGSMMDLAEDQVGESMDYDWAAAQGPNAPQAPWDSSHGIAEGWGETSAMKEWHTSPSSFIPLKLRCYISCWLEKNQSLCMKNTLHLPKLFLSIVQSFWHELLLKAIRIMTIGIQNRIFQTKKTDHEL